MGTSAGQAGGPLAPDQTGQARCSRGAAAGMAAARPCAPLRGGASPPAPAPGRSRSHSRSAPRPCREPRKGARGSAAPANLCLRRVPWCTCCPRLAQPRLAWAGPCRRTLGHAHGTSPQAARGAVLGRDLVEQARLCSLRQLSWPLPLPRPAVWDCAGAAAASAPGQEPGTAALGWEEGAGVLPPTPAAARQRGAVGRAGGGEGAVDSKIIGV